MKTNSCRALVLAGLMGLAALSACGPQKHENQGQQRNQAQENFQRGNRPRLRVVCAQDIQKFCATDDRPRRCLRDNIDKLSDACKNALAWRRNRMEGGNRDNDGQ